MKITRPNEPRIFIGPDKSAKQSSFRKAITLILVGAAGFGVRAFLDEVTDKKSEPPAAESAQSRRPARSSMQMRPEGSSGLVPADEFDNNPELFVDPKQCRELVLKWDGRVISDGEITERAKVITQRGYEENAKKLTKELCIKDPSEQDAIVKTLEDMDKETQCNGPKHFLGLVESKGVWELNIECKKKTGVLYDTSINLTRKPECRPPKTEWEQSREQRKINREADIKERIEMLGKHGAGFFTDSIDLEQLHEAARAVGMESKLESFFNWTKKMQSLNTDQLTREEKLKITCEWQLFSEGKMKSMLFEDDEMKNNSDLRNLLGDAIGSMNSLSKAIFYSEGIMDSDDLDQCLDYIGSPN